MARRRRPLARRKRVAITVAVGGVAVGLAAVFLIPLIRRRFQQPSITIPEDEIKQTFIPAKAPNYNVTYTGGNTLGPDAPFYGPDADPFLGIYTGNLFG